MPKINYSKMVIYKIICKNQIVSYFFVGSSTNIYKKKFDHKRKTLCNDEDILYKTINANGGWENWELVVLEKCQCINKGQIVELE